MVWMKSRTPDYAQAAQFAADVHAAPPNRESSPTTSPLPLNWSIAMTPADQETYTARLATPRLLMAGPYACGATLDRAVGESVRAGVGEKGHARVRGN